MFLWAKGPPFRDGEEIRKNNAPIIHVFMDSNVVVNSLAIDCDKIYWHWTFVGEKKFVSFTYERVSVIVVIIKHTITNSWILFLSNFSIDTCSCDSRSILEISLDLLHGDLVAFYLIFYCHFLLNFVLDTVLMVLNHWHEL